MGPSVGSKLRELRGDMSASELSRRSGVTTAQILKIERDLVSPRTETLERLTRALGVDSASLFTGREVPPLELSEDESTLLAEYRTLGPTLKRHAVNYLREVKSLFRRANELICPALG